MKTINIIIKNDFLLMIRDKMILYLLFGPLLMAALIMLLLGQLSDAVPRLVVSAMVPPEIIQQLQTTADVELVADENLLVSRVAEFGNKTGVKWQDGQISLLFQGNEGSHYEEAMQSLITGAVGHDPVEFQLHQISSGPAGLTGIIMAALLLSPALFGGIISGFQFVSEKETKMIDACKIAPAARGYYLAARNVTAVIIGLVIGLLISIIMNLTEIIPAILSLTICSLPLFLLIMMLFGTYAVDKMTAVSMIKLFMVIFVVLPLTSAFVTGPMIRFYYPLPMYWLYQGLYRALGGRSFWFQGIMTLILSGLFAAFYLYLSYRSQKAE